MWIIGIDEDHIPHTAVLTSVQISSEESGYELNFKSELVRYELIFLNIHYQHSIENGEKTDVIKIEIKKLKIKIHIIKIFVELMDKTWGNVFI